VGAIYALTITIIIIIIIKRMDLHFKNLMVKNPAIRTSKTGPLRKKGH